MYKWTVEDDILISTASFYIDVNQILFILLLVMLYKIVLLFPLFSKSRIMSDVVVTSLKLMVWYGMSLISNGEYTKNLLVRKLRV